jgi:phosphatidylinositol-3-phosphatase
MKSVLENLKRSAGLAIACTALCSTIALADDDGRNNRRDFDRVFVIMMENHGFDQVIGALVPTADATLPNQQLLTPFITHLAQTQGLATYYFGTTHPSLPNYLATIAGDFFGVQDDNDSCFVQPGPTPGCHNFNTTNIVDQLESKNISWEALMESAPSVGFLGSRAPADPGQKLYAQKHNPFVYFDDIVKSPARMAKIKPFDLTSFKTQLSLPAAMPRFVYIAPNQCNDQHGTGGTVVPPSVDCSADADALAAGDLFLKNTVTAITASPSFTARSVVFIVWDENDFSGQQTCCGPSPTGVGGGHATALVVTKNGKPLKSARPFDHYSLLATIEDGFDLPRLVNAKTANTMFDLIPSGED